tara:strand:+ start:829 stop:1563 length:735 start_codon:yes stop_codon:yes gene_type:complete
MKGLVWGFAEEIGSPAYWAAQAWMWEVEAPAHYKLGRSLEEELMACLLGGYGIPAEVGLAAYERLRAVNAESPCRLLDEESVLELLADPLDLNGRLVRYRFAKQKSTYLAGSMRALQSLDREAPDRELRDALTALPGVGPKTASWIVRNWRDSDFVSILDIHILRAGRMLQIFPEGKSVERHYLELEAAFLDFAEAISVKASILDSVMWMNMRQIPAAILRRLVDPSAEVFSPKAEPVQLSLAL